MSLCDLKTIFPRPEWLRMILCTVPVMITFSNYRDFIEQQDARFVRSVAFEWIDEDITEVIEAANQLSVRRDPSQLMRVAPTLERDDQHMTSSYCLGRNDLGDQAFRTLEDSFRFDLVEFDVSDEVREKGDTRELAHHFLRSFGTEFMGRMKGIRVCRKVFAAFLDQYQSLAPQGLKILYELRRVKFRQFLSPADETADDFVVFLEQVLKFFHGPEIHLSPMQMEYFKEGPLDKPENADRVRPMSIFHLRSLPKVNGEKSDLTNPTKPAGRSDGRREGVAAILGMLDLNNWQNVI